MATPTEEAPAVNDAALLEKGLATSAAIGAAMAARSVASSAWTRATGEQPPRNPADRDVPWRQALLWSVLSGVLVGLARLVARRSATGLAARLGDRQPTEVAEDIEG